MAWAWRISLFIAAVAAFAVAMAPARAFIRPTEGQLAFDRVEGPIWNATLYGARLDGLDAGDVHLRISLFGLMRGAIVADGRLHGSQLDGDIRLVRSLGGGLEISSPMLVVINAGPPGLGGKGRTTARAFRIEFAHGACRTATGRLDSNAFDQMLVDPALTSGLPLSGGVACEGQAARLTLTGDQTGGAVQAWLDLQGDGTGRWRMSARTQLSAVRAALAAAGFAPQGESGALATEGVFKWLAF